MATCELPDVEEWNEESTNTESVESIECHNSGDVTTSAIYEFVCAAGKRLLLFFLLITIFCIK